MIERVAIIVSIGFAIAGAFMWLGNRHVTPATASMRWLKFIVYFVIVLVILAAGTLGHAWVFLILSLVAAMATHEYVRVARSLPDGISLLFAVIVGCMLWQCWRLGAAGVVFIFLIVATADGFAQVVGQWLGRHALAAHISPSKTIEGACGGALAGVVVAVLARDLCALGVAAAAVIGVCVSFAGVGGDLVASWIKRRAGIKDFSAVLPGHGGFLDRFDSLIAALALVGPLLPSGQ